MSSRDREKIDDNLLAILKSIQVRLMDRRQVRRGLLIRMKDWVRRRFYSWLLLWNNSDSKAEDEAESSDHCFCGGDTIGK